MSWDVMVWTYSSALPSDFEAVPGEPEPLPLGAAGAVRRDRAARVW
jgi:hypothetical protein